MRNCIRIHLVSIIALFSLAVVSCAKPKEAPKAVSVPEKVLAKALVGKDGGKVEAPGVTLSLPAGALAEDVEITITETNLSPEGYGLHSQVFRFEPAGIVFLKPIQVSMNFVGESAIPAIFWSTETNAEAYDELLSEQKGSVVAAETTHFSTAFVGEMSLPPAPTGLAASATNGGVVLRWTQVKTANRYMVFRKAPSDTEFSQITDYVGGTSYVDANAVLGSQYGYYLIANNAKGDSPASMEVWTTIPPTPPVTPVFQMTIGQAGTANGELKSAYGLYYDGTYLYVNDDGNYRVQRYGAGGVAVDWLGKVGGIWGYYSSGTAEYMSLNASPFVDASGNLFIQDWCDPVMKFSSAGSLISGTLTTSGFCVYDFAVDSSGNVFVQDNQDYVVYKYDPSGSEITNFGGFGTGAGKFLGRGPIEVDSLGNVYVGDEGRVSKFNNDGEFVMSWPIENNSDAFSIDENDTLYIGGNDLLSYDTNGKLLGVYEIANAGQRMSIRDGILYQAQGTTVKVYSLLGHLPPAVPPAPATLQANLGTGGVALYWSGVTSAVDYDIYRSTNLGGPYSLVNLNIYDSHHTTDYDVVSGTTYYYRVVASNDRGASSPSPIDLPPIFATQPELGLWQVPTIPGESQEVAIHRLA